MNTGRWIARGATGLTGAAALAAVIAAPASATVTEFVIDPAGGPYVVGQRYQLYASGELSRMDLQNPRVVFFDNGECIGNSGTLGGYEGGGTYASVQWVPTIPGTHVLVTRHAGTSRTITVTVERAPAGSVTASPLNQGACGLIETGSLGRYGILPALTGSSAGS
ncbi:hypothetical protein ABZ319_19100 [Nocardia sp. NPDC005978]|uniref:hypothetical protein n=1 Tax=Nocardia sp. NPDC005978 TaxID=3156725 RepID=UPI0033BB24EB